MTPEKKAKQIAERQRRKSLNQRGKIVKAHLRKQADIALGKTVIVSEVEGVKTYSFPPEPPAPPTPPRLSWLGGKTYKQSNPQKDRSGHKPEHTAAVIENASRTLAKEVDKVLKPEGAAA